MIENEFMMVSVLCQTYNHEQYISECLQSIVAQKVNFRYEILVHDDASTDNTANIIRKFEREYPDLIKPIYQEVNQWSLGNKVFSGIQLPRCTGKYIAICEGDDYWTDPLKLQKQVDILECNENIGLVYAKARVYLQSKCKYADNLFGEYRASLNEMIFKGNAIPTLTAMFRREIAVAFRQEFSQIKGWKMGDYPLWLYIFGKYEVAFEDEVIGVYRMLENSASHLSSCKRNIRFSRNYFEIAYFFADYFGLNKSVYYHIKQSYFSYVVRLCIQKQYKQHVISRYLRRFYREKGPKILCLRVISMFGCGRFVLRYLYKH